MLQLEASRAPKLVHGDLVWGPLWYGKLRVTDASGRVLPARLGVEGTQVRISFDARHAQFPVRVDPLMWSQQQELTAADGTAQDYFGSALAIAADGRTALVGAQRKTVDGDVGRGAAYVFTLAGGTWSQTGKLIASDGTTGDSFGQSVALSADGSTALVGSYLKSVGGNAAQGVVYVFTLANGSWSQSQELTSSDGAKYDSFGRSLALADNGATALIAAPTKTVGGNVEQGEAYVFTLANGSWSQTAKLTASDGATGDAFGLPVALAGNGGTALLAAYEKNVGRAYGQGVVYVFTLANGQWNQTKELTASDGTTNDVFGASLALDSGGDVALVGATHHKVGSNNGEGAAYVFTLDNGSWNQAAELTASDGVADNQFGDSVGLAANGATALVGAVPLQGLGAAYIYDEPASGWTTTSSFTARLTGKDEVAGEGFGEVATLAANGTIALAGAFAKTVNGNSAQGVVYAFGLSDLANLGAVLSMPASVQPGASFASQYILTNNGATTLGPITVTLPLPASGVQYVSVEATQGSCSYDSSTKIASCDLGSIGGNGGEATATLNVKATGAAGSVIAESASIANLTPNFAQSGTTLIALPLPAPPTLSGLGDVAVTAPDPGSASFTLTGSGVLTLTATSSNTTLLPDANISGAAACKAAGPCTLTLTPASGQSGTATVSLTVTDGNGQSGNGSFTFQVTAAGSASPPTAGSGSGGGGGFGLLGLLLLVPLAGFKTCRSRGSTV